MIRGIGETPYGKGIDETTNDDSSNALMAELSPKPAPEPAKDAGGQSAFGDMKFTAAFMKSNLLAAKTLNAGQIQPSADEVETQWTNFGNRKLYADAQDIAQAKEIFYQGRPELKGQKIKQGGPEALELQHIQDRIVQNKYNALIKEAVKEFPGLDPKILKSMLIQESNLNPRIPNEYGYDFAGIAQMGSGEARKMGLKVNGEVDERLDPNKAIPAAVKLMKAKMGYLKGEAFKEYGTPKGDDYFKFALAAYNGGEGAVKIAMRAAYKKALAEATGKGLKGDAAISYAKEFASKWDNIIQPAKDFKTSPLYAMTSQVYKKHPVDKYNEIARFPVEIFERARQ